MKHTKGKFKDGHTGWKVDNRETNGTKGYEIHWSDDGECITDHVYTIEDAKLIASSPELLEVLQFIFDFTKGKPIGSSEYQIHMLCYKAIKKATE